MPSTSTWVLGAGLGLFASFDVFWFLRLAYTHLSSLVRAPIDLLSGEDGVVYSLCTTNDVDYFCHMNNGRYLRELDFARFDFYFRSGLSAYFRSEAARGRGVFIVQHGAMIRYRRSMDFLMPYRIHTRLVYFDERALYFEQRFVSIADDFVRAVALCKNTAVNCDVVAVMRDHIGVRDRMPCPPEVQKFLEANEISSHQLRVEAGVSQDGSKESSKNGDTGDSKKTA